MIQVCGELSECFGLDDLSIWKSSGKTNITCCLRQPFPVVALALLSPFARHKKNPPVEGGFCRYRADLVLDEAAHGFGEQQFVTCRGIKLGIDFLIHNKVRFNSFCTGLHIIRLAVEFKFDLIICNAGGF